MSSDSTLNHANALIEGTLIDKYRIAGVLGHGGFGITYLADDESLRKKVAIKECLPVDICTRTQLATIAPISSGHQTDFEWALRRFVEEAQILARFDHPNIVRVSDVFKANNTAYMVTRFVEGCSLESWLRSHEGPPSEAALRRVLDGLLSGLGVVHAADVLHRDIKPDNVYLDRSGAPILLDFGSARNAVTNRSRPITSVVSPGYAPFEQYYESGSQGPWSDLYAVGAVMYRAITGKPPPEATKRERKDPYVPLLESHGSLFSPAFLGAIDRMLCQREEDRPQSVAEVVNLLNAPPAQVDPAQDSSVAAAAQPAGEEAPPRRAGRQPRLLLGLLAVACVCAVVWFVWPSSEHAPATEIVPGPAAPVVLKQKDSKPQSTDSSPKADQVAASTPNAEEKAAAIKPQSVSPSEPSVPPPPSLPTQPVEPPAPVRWTVNTAPSSASVLFKGRNIPAPCTLEISEFEVPVSITVSAPGYCPRDFTRTFSARQAPLEEVLALLPRPRIEFQLQPAGLDLSRVTLTHDGQPVAWSEIRKTGQDGVYEVMAEWLDTGAHRLRASSAGYADAEQLVLVSEPSRVGATTLSLQPLPARLALTWAGPSECVVRVDDRVFPVVASGMVLPLPHRPEPYVLQASAEGYDFAGAVSVVLDAPGQVESRVLQFTPKVVAPTEWRTTWIAQCDSGALRSFRLVLRDEHGRVVFSGLLSQGETVSLPAKAARYKLEADAGKAGVLPLSSGVRISADGQRVTLKFTVDSGPLY